MLVKTKFTLVEGLLFHSFINSYQVLIFFTLGLRKFIFLSSLLPYLQAKNGCGKILVMKWKIVGDDDDDDSNDDEGEMTVMMMNNGRNNDDINNDFSWFSHQNKRGICRNKDIGNETQYMGIDNDIANNDYSNSCFVKVDH